MYVLIRSLLFLCPPERAHHLSLALFKLILSIPLLKPLVLWLSKPNGPSVELFGLNFTSPVGLAAGFDKNAEHTRIIECLGFGFIEIGSVTFKPWVGNAQPRLFRLPKDTAIINRMGLNNQGAEAVAKRLSSVDLSIPLFVNVAKTPDKRMSESETVQDYCRSIALLKPYADVMVLNISCPNADGGKTFEDPTLLSQLLTGVRGVLDEDEKPLLIKLSPDLSVDQLEETVAVCEGFNVSGYTATNTTTTRQNMKTSDDVLQGIGNGGLSGQPLHSRAVQTVRNIRGLTEKPIVGVGGIFDGETAQNFLSAGASLVQIYSGFIYGGPMIVKKISKGLKD
jgi:dihydroorotate dehydrogenase